MPFMKKEDMLAAAERLGVNLSGLSWSEQQKAVQEALAKEPSGWTATAYGIDSFSDSPKPEPKPIKKESKMEENPEQKFLEEYEAKMLKSYKEAKPVRITAEIKPMRNALFKYDEDLGEGVEVEDVSYVSGMPNLDQREQMTSTYAVKGKTGRKVFAKSTLPRENVMIYRDLHKHWLAPIVRDFQGRDGYIWSHPKYGGIKKLLIDSGYFEDYRDLFRGDLHPANIWMAGGKFFAVNMQLCERIFKEIERKAKKEEENGY